MCISIYIYIYHREREIRNILQARHEADDVEPGDGDAADGGGELGAYVCACMYVYIHIERERDRERKRHIYIYI